MLWLKQFNIKVFSDPVSDSSSIVWMIIIEIYIPPILVYYYQPNSR